MAIKDQHKLVQVHGLFFIWQLTRGAEEHDGPWMITTKEEPNLCLTRKSQE